MWARNDKGRRSGRRYQRLVRSSFSIYPTTLRQLNFFNIFSPFGKQRLTTGLSNCTMITMMTYTSISPKTIWQSEQTQPFCVSFDMDYNSRHILGADPG